jgi:hypothetical protein
MPEDEDAPHHDSPMQALIPGSHLFLPFHYTPSVSPSLPQRLPHSENTRKQEDTTYSSKQCIHFFLSDRWPPTSTILILANERSERIIVIAAGRKKTRTSNRPSKTSSR